MSKQDNLTEFLTGVADAIREKKETEELINPQDFEDEIRSIETGIDTSDGTATNDDILYGRVAYAKDKQLRGTILTYPSSTKFIFAAAPGNGSITMDVAGVVDMGGYWDYFDSFRYYMNAWDDYFYMKVYKNKSDGTYTERTLYTTKTRTWTNENNRTIIFFTDRVTNITNWDKANYDGPYSLGPAVLAKSVTGATQPTAKKYFAEDVTVYPVLEEKAIVPTKEVQNVAVSDGYAGLAKVSVAAIPDEFVETSDASATGNDVRVGKTAYVASGKVTGTIEDYDGSSEPASGKSLFVQRIDGSITEVNENDLAGITEIGTHAFYKCNNLTSITIPDNVKSIGYSAFAYCVNLINIMIKNGVTNIREFAFSDCSSLKSIIIPNSVTSIDGKIFTRCSSLTNIVLPDSITSISTSMFSNCSSLISITIPDSVTRIESDAFSGCSSLTSVTIPDGVTSIGYSVFQDCRSLTSITISDSVTSIGGYVFSNCGSLTSVTIPGDVTKIFSSTFYHCNKLESVVIGNSVAGIDSYAFDSCGTATESGTTYTLLPITPPTILSSTFQNAKINKIIVPIGTANTYKAATNWSALADYIEEAEA